ncbi:outer membrane usher protein [Erwinia sp. DT-104]|uniref:outer membrane usher protein n=1 Tax=Erwinia sp. DT-104 TaxID=3396161 RepID=UPI003F1B523C
MPMSVNIILKKDILWLWHAIFLLILCCFARSVEARGIEFNTDLLDVKDRTNIDLSRFSQAGYIMPGNYTLKLQINDNELPEQSVDWFTTEDNEKESKPCLTAALVNFIGLKPELRPQLTWWHEGQCLNTDSLPGMSQRADLGTNTLYLTIPQIYLEYRAPNWDPPAQWDEGIPGLLFDYYASAQTRHEHEKKTDNTFTGNGTAGANVGPWRLRADWQGRYDNQASNNLNWDWTRFYAWRALPHRHARLGVGEHALFSDIFDSFTYSGLSLRSDDNMLPPNLRGYSPEISGIAKTSARVVISQKGRVIKETRVAAGPFRIQDLNETISGELDVRVEEQDGSVQTFSINTASVPYLTRPGMVRYKLAAGRPSNTQHHMEGEGFVNGEFSWGVSNGWSLYGGTIASEEYQALALGTGRDLMAFGALSLDFTQAFSRRLPDPLPDTQKGASWRVSYSKRFDETDSEMTFAGYRYSEQGYMSMQDYLNAHKYGRAYGNGKEMYTAIFSQQLRDWRASFYLNYSHQTWWDKPDNDRFTLTATKYFDAGRLRNVSLSATAWRNKYDGSNDDGIYLSLSLPWGNSGTLNYNGSFNQGNNSHQASYFNTMDERNNYQISGGVAGQETLASGYYTYQGDRARINVNASYQGNSYSALSLSAQGGVTATAQGAALHRTSRPGGTRMLIDTAVKDIPVKSYGADTLSNHFGKAVIADISSYYRNRISIDINALPDNAEASASVIQRTLTEGAIGYGGFKVVTGSKTMAVLRLENGEAPPFGATVKNSQRQEVGIVNDDGSIYLSGIQPGITMRVSWSGKEQCEFKLPESLSGDISQRLLLPCRLL